MSLTVACVLRSGGDFRAEHAARLRSAVAEHLPGARWRCLSDVPEVATDPLVHGWPGWWSKIELFRPGLLVGPTLYLDLDTVIVGSLSEIGAAISPGRLLMLRDFFYPERAGSGMMGWAGDWSAIHAAFAADPEAHMRRCRSRAAWGDQGFIAGLIEPAFWQDAIPGQIVSYKAHCRRGVPAGARVVCFHGHPRPWEVGWLA